MIASLHRVVASLRRSYGLLGAFLRASAIADLEYRFNFLLKVTTDVLWYAAQLSVFEILFRHANAISGWTLDSTRVFMGMLFAIDATWMFFFSANLDRFSDKVRKGELDLLLAKPVSSQMMMSLQKISIAYAINFALAVGWLGYAVWRLPETPPWTRLAPLAVALPCSICILYSLRFFFSASALIFDRAENLNYVWYQIYRLATRPDAIYPSFIRYAILTVVPVGFIASVPARSLLEAPSYSLLAGGIGLSIFFLWLTTRYWAFGLRRYSSASS